MTKEQLERGVRDLRRANLDGANLQDANLVGVAFSGVTRRSKGSMVKIFTVKLMQRLTSILKFMRGGGRI